MLEDIALAVTGVPGDAWKFGLGAIIALLIIAALILLARDRAAAVYHELEDRKARAGQRPREPLAPRLLPAARNERGDGGFTVAATGAEGFSPDLLEPGRSYHVTMIGTIRYNCNRSGHRYSFMSDAVYSQDSQGNFTKPHKRLRFDGSSGKPRIVARDRGAHRYTFEVRGAGERIGVCLVPPRSGYITVHPRPGCSESYHVTVAPDSMTSLACQLRTVPRPLPAPAPAPIVRSPEVIEAERIAWETRLIEELYVQTESLRNFAQPIFRKDFAMKFFVDPFYPKHLADGKTATILALAPGAAKAYRALFDSAAAARGDFVTLFPSSVSVRVPGPVAMREMREQEPELYARLVGPMECFLEVERIAVLPPSEPKPEPPPQRRLTVDEYRERRILRPLDVEADDLQAALCKIMERKQDLLDVLEDEEFSSFSEDDRDFFRQKVDDWTRDALERAGGKGDGA